MLRLGVWGSGGCIYLDKVGLKDRMHVGFASSKKAMVHPLAFLDLLGYHVDLSSADHWHSTCAGSPPGFIGADLELCQVFVFMFFSMLKLENYHLICIKYMSTRRERACFLQFVCLFVFLQL